MLYRPFCQSATFSQLNKALSAKYIRLISCSLNYNSKYSTKLGGSASNCEEILGSSLAKVSLRGNTISGFLNATTREFQSNCSKMSESNSNGTQHDRSKCVFCRIVDGKESNEIFYQDEEIVVFQDIRPAAKYHLLVVTREHIKDSKSLVSSHIDLLDRLTKTGLQVLNEKITKDTPDTDPEQVQKLMGFHWPPFHTVAHLHLHIIAPSDQMGFIARTIFRPNSFWFVTPEYVRERLEKMAATESSNSNPQ